MNGDFIQLLLSYHVVFDEHYIQIIEHFYRHTNRHGFSNDIPEGRKLCVMENVFEYRMQPLINHENHEGNLSSDFVCNASEILNTLMAAKEQGTAVGISSTVLNAGIMITAVEDIVISEGETVVILKPYDITGYILPTNKLQLSEISAVCPFQSSFRNPFLDNIDKEKKWFF